jgi:hypothetical protein
MIYLLVVRGGEASTNNQPVGNNIVSGYFTIPRNAKGCMRYRMGPPR